ncbi:GyrI-like domain-containing protein [Dyadobacter arcticus]|uniref:Effector-binding domain-containing protein n=1 Tax=Dyadobacter arcticus TaxID=1078754 RepID=A0ABX0USR9_9BACT|nr:GyrI-like domain-containing protein [Dyadobacter arcticus]NIJ56012.1 effector-binding domain-containing protein [Dyadobacter arcticus]
MQTRTIQPIHVLYFETKTSLAQLSQHVRHVARRLYQDALHNDIEITGPIYWVYEGADGQLDTIFTLTIALPIVSTAQLTNSEFKTKYLESFNCITEQLYGDWNTLGTVYGSLISEIMSQNKTMSGQNREIYINRDFENPERNITEVQVGIL